MSGLAALFSSILLGSMLFFAVIVAPTISRTLEEESLKFARNLFPKYYLWGMGVSTLAVISTMVAGSYTAILQVIILLGFVYGHQILQPKAANAKDQWLASDTAQDKAHYKSLHKRAVIIHAAQVLMLVIIVVTTQILRYQQP